MARRSQREEPEQLRKKLIELLESFEQKLRDDNLREQVKALIPANYYLRDLGSSLISDEQADSARDRILAYLRKYPGELVQGDELMIVAGISEYARRIRELRKEMGWPILTGQAMKEIMEDEVPKDPENATKYKPDTYILTEDRQDRDAAYRWNLANQIRKSQSSVKNKILKYFRANVGERIIGEELMYLANGKSEWARRVRELRTEDGWPIVTRVTGLPDLPVGTYVLEEDRQAEVHDRHISDLVRAKVLKRDSFSCKYCQWNTEQAHKADRRAFLELHHIEHHAKGGQNTEENLITLCNVCHDEVHRGGIDVGELLWMIQTDIK